MMAAKKEIIPMVSDDLLTSIPIKRYTRNRLALFCGKSYRSDMGMMSYDEAINRLLDFWYNKHE